ncbi:MULTISPECIES: hypothetical protein [unclassified Arthrobacter]|uniref:hypothetical protein n=1 Tax=unclassified Arthrobacter TaxID=235627 RepID=UPI00209742D8|nr:MULTISPECIES: hypothetical protein [unclassified Arthrobacter]MDD1478603.1 hypothetical protein [Arthrobacter sp. H16F315]MDN4643970.1 hypothetical protein [Arthrobacter sp. PsM3]
MNFRTDPPQTPASPASGYSSLLFYLGTAAFVLMPAGAIAASAARSPPRDRASGSTANQAPLPG